MDSHAAPTSFSIVEERVPSVDVHLNAHDLEGKLLFDRRASHLFETENGLIRRLEIRDPRSDRSRCAAWNTMDGEADGLSVGPGKGGVRAHRRRQVIDQAVECAIGVGAKEPASD